VARAVCAVAPFCWNHISGLSARAGPKKFTSAAQQNAFELMFQDSLQHSPERVEYLLHSLQNVVFRLVEDP